MCVVFLFFSPNSHKTTFVIGHITFGWQFDTFFSFSFCFLVAVVDEYYPNWKMGWHKEAVDRIPDESTSSIHPFWLNGQLNGCSYTIQIQIRANPICSHFYCLLMKKKANGYPFVIRFSMAQAKLRLATNKYLNAFKWKCKKKEKKSKQQWADGSRQSPYFNLFGNEDGDRELKSKKRELCAYTQVTNEWCGKHLVSSLFSTHRNTL